MSAALPPDPMAAEREARNWAMFCHLAALSNMIVPFGNIVGPLIAWLVKKDQYPLVDANGRASLNFQISYMIYKLVIVFGGVAAIVGGIVAMSMDKQLAPFGVALIFGFYGMIGIAVLISLIEMVMVIIGGVKAYGGEVFEYPLAIRFLK